MLTKEISYIKPLIKSQARTSIEKLQVFNFLIKNPTNIFQQNFNHNFFFW